MKAKVYSAYVASLVDICASLQELPCNSRMPVLACQEQECITIAVFRFQPREPISLAHSGLLFLPVLHCDTIHPQGSLLGKMYNETGMPFACSNPLNPFFAGQVCTPVHVRYKSHVVSAVLSITQVV